MIYDMLNRIAASVDRSLPMEQAIPVRIRALLSELRGCGSMVEIEELLSQMDANAALLEAAVMAGGQIHLESVVFEGVAGTA